MRKIRLKFWVEIRVEIRVESKILWPYLIFFEVKNGSKNRLKLDLNGLVNIMEVIKQRKIALKTGPQAPNKGFFSGAPSPHLLPNEKLTFLICGAFVGGFVI
jgi:hypothetical protein